MSRYPSIREISDLSSIADKAKAALRKSQSQSSDSLAKACGCTLTQLFCAIRDNLDFRRVGGMNGWYWSLWAFAQEKPVVTPQTPVTMTINGPRRKLRERCNSARTALHRALDRVGSGTVATLAAEIGVGKPAIYAAIKRYPDDIVIERSTGDPRGAIIAIRLRSSGGAPAA